MITALLHFFYAKPSSVRSHTYMICSFVSYLVVVVFESLTSKIK